MKEVIKALEEKNVSDKPWQLKGEIQAKARPENSLLQEHLDFDVSAKPTSQRTEEDNKSIETLIKQRIKDKFFDDVERKVIFLRYIQIMQYISLNLHFKKYCSFSLGQKNRKR